MIQMNNCIVKITVHKETQFIPSYEVGGLSLSVLTLEILGFIYVASCLVSGWGANTSTIRNQTPKVEFE